MLKTLDGEINRLTYIALKKNMSVYTEAKYDYLYLDRITTKAK